MVGRVAFAVIWLLVYVCVGYRRVILL